VRRKASAVKSCKECGESDMAKLVPDKSRPGGVRSKCRSCREKSNRGGKNKENHLKRTYGLSLSEFNTMLTKQKECCLICQKHRNELPVDLHVDHCHTTGKVRGLLCYSCNAALGGFKDSLPLLASAFEYILKHG